MLLKLLSFHYITEHYLQYANCSLRFVLHKKSISYCNGVLTDLNTTYSQQVISYIVADCLKLAYNTTSENSLREFLTNIIIITREFK